MVDVDAVVKELKSEGVVVVDGCISVNDCEEIKAKLDRVVAERIQNGIYCGTPSNPVLDNYFMDDNSLVKLIYQELTDSVMRLLIDDDYVLISPSARNRQLTALNTGSERVSGVGWHTDSRYIQGGMGVCPSLCYMSILCLDDFNEENGATEFLPRSHLKYVRPPNRKNIKGPKKVLEAAQGSIVFLDTGLWHRVGEAGIKSRWGVFNTYGPWFVKPYHQFSKMFTEDVLQTFDPLIRQLLHCDSTPPISHLERMATLRRVGF